MFNRLTADPEIRSHFQFWFFQCDSGNPIALSSSGGRGVRPTKDAKKLVGRDGIEPPTPGFSDLSLGIANDAEVRAS
jgi:hypothetical protein